MMYTRRSMLTNTEHTRFIPLTEQAFEACVVNWRKGMLMQDAFPMLNSDQREFVKNGITPEEWDNLED